jgi:hypothetical protein
MCLGGRKWRCSVNETREYIYQLLYNILYYMETSSDRGGRIPCQCALTSPQVFESKTLATDACPRKPVYTEFFTLLRQSLSPVRIFTFLIFYIYFENHLYIGRIPLLLDQCLFGYLALKRLQNTICISFKLKA